MSEPYVRCVLGHRVRADRAYCATRPDGTRSFACARGCAAIVIHGPGLRGVQAAHVVLMQDEREAGRQGELAFEGPR